MLRVAGDSTNNGNKLNGKAKPSFTSMCLDQNSEKSGPEVDENVIRDTASMFLTGMLFSFSELKLSTYVVVKGGTDTIPASVYTFLLAMLCHPDKQAKVQEELDRVIGHDRLPDYGDEANLPYFSAALRESFRQDIIIVSVSYIADLRVVTDGDRPHQ